MVKRRDDGEDHRACGVRAQHILKVDAIEGRVAHGEDELAALLQADVGSALDESVGNSRRDLREAAGGARDHHHALHDVRTAGDRGPDVGVEQVFSFLGCVRSERSGNFRRLRNV